MKDRVPANPGRVKITPEGGSAYYATMERADNPTQQGTPLNKATLLKDATASKFGLGSNAVPDDVLSLIKGLLDSKALVAAGSYTGTGTFGQSNPNTLTFPFPVKAIAVGGTSTLKAWSSDGVAILANLPKDNTYYQGGIYTGASSKVYTKLSADGKTMSWYDTTASNQLNNDGWLYHYIALG